MTTSDHDASHTAYAVVTGASSGIGEAVARRLAQRGQATLLVARREDRLVALADELRTHAPCETLVVDLCDREAVRDVLLARLRDTAVDVLVNNAGFGSYKPFVETDAAEHDALLEVNYHAPASLVRAVLPAMLERQRGHIINIGSISAVMGPWGHGPYAAAKSALNTLTQSLAAEHKHSGVHFSYVNPGIVSTEFFDSPAYAKLYERARSQAVPVDVAAKRIVELLDRPRLELTIPAHYRVLSLIAALSPRLAHRLVRKNSMPPESER